MGNQRVEITEEILRAFDNLVKESGVSRQEFISYVAKVYNIGKDTIDINAYYESFTA